MDFADIVLNKGSREIRIGDLGTGITVLSMREVCGMEWLLYQAEEEGYLDMRSSKGKVRFANG